MKFDNKQQKNIVNIISADQEPVFLNWRDYKWQLKHSIKDIETFEKLTDIKFSKKEKSELKKTTDKFPISITPYYLSLIDKDDYLNDPVFKQSFPDPRELILEKYDMSDPLHEDKDSPVAGITHRYPDRVLFMISNMCSMYCRHCTRKRKVGDVDCIPSKKEIMNGINYIKNTSAIRDVLLSGGDPFMLSDDYLDWILTELQKIQHVEVIRIGTRIPAVLPYRITDDLIKILRKHHPLWINTHFNHPREITASAKESLRKLADAGIPLGNQSVLLAGVNDCPRIIKKLSHDLVQSRVRPYYLYQCDLTEGLSHFRTPVGKGIEIIEGLIGHTSGFAIPTYVIDAPGGAGKIPVMPNYIISWSTNKIVLRNYEGVISTYKEPDSYEPIFCDRNCADCKLQLKLDSAEEIRATGIGKLLADYDKTISLTPKGTNRMARRTDETGTRSDVVVKIGNSTIQHGKENNRIYLMKLHKSDIPGIITKLELLAINNRYTKIFAKVPISVKQIFMDNKYIVEAHIPKFYKGNEDVLFFAKYFSLARKTNKNKKQMTKVLKIASKKSGVPKSLPLNTDFHCKKAKLRDADEMAEIYKQVSETYPFPIYNADYIRRTMQKNIEYFGIWHDDTIVALASSEMDLDMLNVEMTDFATLSGYRGNHFAIHLLKKMEEKVRKRGMKTAYTIARSVSYGMNVTFAKSGYTFAGTLVNNTHISGSLENMNVWFKNLVK